MSRDHAAPLPHEHRQVSVEPTVNTEGRLVVARGARRTISPHLFAQEQNI